MSIGTALKFMKRGMAEAALRDRLNGAVDLPELMQILEEEGLTFSPVEFEDAVNSTLLKCQTWDEANALREFKFWWELLQRTPAPYSCGPSSGCSSNTCGSCRSQ